MTAAAIFSRRALAPRGFILFLLAAWLAAGFTPPPQADSVHGRPKTQVRPALSGPTQLYSTEHFIIHYTLEAEDAVSPNDEDGDQLPDYIAAVAEALELSWQHQVEAMGWRLPLPDEGEGGDTRLDVYLEDQNDLFGTGDLFGYTDTFGGFVGDNPHTPAKESHTAYGYLSLDNDYDPDQFGLYEQSSLDAMRTTAAHEFNHALQSAYDDEDPYAWLYEATAVWMEDEVYPEIGDARRYLADYMDAPDICPLSVGRDDQDVRWYGGWILLRYLAEQHGGPEIIRELWENLATQDGLAALETTLLTRQQTSLTELLVNFSVANLLKSNCPANAPYCYRYGSDYLRPYVEGSLYLEAGEFTHYMPKDGVQQFGADYIRLKSDGPLQLHFQGSPAGAWQLRLVGLSGQTAKVTPWTGAGPISVTPAAFERMYLVVVNTAPVETEEACGYKNYTLTLAAGRGALRPPLPELPRDPGPYIPSAFSDYQDEETEPIPTLKGGQPITPAEAAIPPLYPGYLPADYTFTKMVSYTLADLGYWQKDYAPGGEPVIGLHYSGAKAGAPLTFVQSPAPPQALATWVNAMDYRKNDVRLVNNQSVHLVEYNQEDGPWSMATFIYQDRFLVIEGPVGLIEMQNIVAGLMANNPS